MKRLYIHFSALLLSALVVSAVEPIDPAVLPQGTEQVDIYLLLGQSNMKGRGALPLEQSLACEYSTYVEYEYRLQP